MELPGFDLFILVKQPRLFDFKNPRLSKLSLAACTNTAALDLFRGSAFEKSLWITDDLIILQLQGMFPNHRFIEFHRKNHG